MTPTKAQEIETLTRWVESLPAGSYLELIFREAGPQIIRMIRDDFTYNPIPELEARQREMQKAVADLEVKRATADAAAREAVGRLESVNHHVAVAKKTARTLADTLNRAAS